MHALSLSRGDLLPLHHVVSPASHRFFWAHQRLGLEPGNQKESIGKVSELWAQNPSLDNFLEVYIFKDFISGLFK